MTKLGMSTLDGHLEDPNKMGLDAGKPNCGADAHDDSHCSRQIL